MAKANKLRLLIGRSYTYNGTTFARGVCKPVDADTHNYLMSLTVRRKTRFLDTTNGLPGKKVRIKKPDTTPKPQTEEVEIPNFRSKLELAEFAEKTHNFKFKGDLKIMRMTDMVETLTKHIVSSHESSVNEPTLKV